MDPKFPARTATRSRGNNLFTTRGSLSAAFQPNNLETTSATREHGLLSLNDNNRRRDYQAIIFGVGRYRQKGWPRGG
jgi:hypothetical protein